MKLNKNQVISIDIDKVVDVLVERKFSDLKKKVADIDKDVEQCSMVYQEVLEKLHVVGKKTISDYFDQFKDIKTVNRLINQYDLNMNPEMIECDLDDTDQCFIGILGFRFNAGQIISTGHNISINYTDEYSLLRKQLEAVTKSRTDKYHQKNVLVKLINVEIPLYRTKAHKFLIERILKLNKMSIETMSSEIDKIH